MSQKNTFDMVPAEALRTMEAFCRAHTLPPFGIVEHLHPYEPRFNTLRLTIRPPYGYAWRDAKGTVLAWAFQGADLRPSNLHDLFDYLRAQELIEI